MFLKEVMPIIDKLCILCAKCVFWINLFYQFDMELQNITKHVTDNRLFYSEGDVKNMFDKKEMKMIRFEAIRKHIMKGEPVFLVKMDGELVEITSAIDMETLLFHNFTGGAFAVYRKKFSGLGTFTKSVRVGNWTVAIGHTRKAGDDICV